MLYHIAIFSKCRDTSIYRYVLHITRNVKFQKILLAVLKVQPASSVYGLREREVIKDSHDPYWGIFILRTSL